MGALVEGSCMEAAQMPDPQPARCYLRKIEGYGVSATGDTFADLSLIHPLRGPIKAQAYRSCFGDLSQLLALVGTEVNLQISPTGLQLKPLAEQVRPDLGDSVDPGPDQGLAADGAIWDPDSAFFPPEASLAVASPTPGSCTTPTIPELAAMVAGLARDLNLPTAMWVHLPGRQDHPSSDKQR